MNHQFGGGAHGATKLPLHVLRLKELVELTKLSRSTLYALMKAGTFPAGFLLAPRARGWLATDVLLWLESRSAQTLK